MSEGLDHNPDEELIEHVRSCVELVADDDMIAEDAIIEIREWLETYDHDGR